MVDIRRVTKRSSGRRRSDSDFAESRSDSRPSIFFSSCSVTQLRTTISAGVVIMVRSTLLRITRPYFNASRSHNVHRIGPQWHGLRKPYSSSIQAQEDALKALPDIDPKSLTVTESTTPKQIVPPEELVFGRTFTGKCCLQSPSPPTTQCPIAH